MGNNSRADNSLSVGALGANLLLRLIQLYGIIGLPLIHRLRNSQRELHLGVLQRGKIYKVPDYPEVKGESYKDIFRFVVSQTLTKYHLHACTRISTQQ